MTRRLDQETGRAVNGPSGDLASRPLAPSWSADLLAAVVTACISIPMCLGIAVLSGAPPSAGLLSGMIGGLVVGWLSGSHTSITGPSAGLTFIIAAQLAWLNSFEAFLLALVLAGAVQIAFGVMRFGWLASFFPSSVLQALLAAIGVILILKNIPHLLGHDTDPVGDMSFLQPDRRTTLSELGTLIHGEVHLGAMIVGLATLALLMLCRRLNRTGGWKLPDFLLALVFGTGLSLLLRPWGSPWLIDGKHLVQLPEWSADQFWGGLLHLPDWSQWNNPWILLTAGLVAVSASLETLLNTSATDRLDRYDRATPPSRELIALGAGNLLAGLMGGIPMSAAVERSAVSLEAGATSKWCTLLHGGILAVAVALVPFIINRIPFSVLAALLLVTGYRLARPSQFSQIWRDGKYQWVPFVVTLLAIVLTNLLIGLFVGLCFAVGFILNSNLRRPLRRVVEKHLGGEVLHIELAEQVSFLNRPVIERALREAPPGTSILLDASNTDYIDPDILAMIRTFRCKAASHQVTVSLRGFRDQYALADDIQFVDFTSRELQESLTPDEALRILREGNERFCDNRRLSRDLGRQVQATSAGQHPFAAVLSCIDSRAPVETILDLGVGDAFTARVAGNVISPKILGSLEYATAVVGSKLILVLGHTKCGAVHAAVKLAEAGQSGAEATGCQHLDSILEEIHPSIQLPHLRTIDAQDEAGRNQFIEEVARRNVIHSVQQIVDTSRTIRKLVDEGRVAVVGAVYDVSSGRVDFLLNQAIGLKSPTILRV